MTLTDLIWRMTLLVQAVVPVVVALALLFFFWGLAQWILNVEDTEKHKEGKQRMIWGVVAFFFIVSIGGLLLILQNTFFGSGIHSTGFNNPNNFGSGSNNQLLLEGSSGGNLNTSNNNDALHNTPSGSSANDSFRIGADSNSASQQSTSGGFEPFQVETWGCLFGRGDCESRTRY